MSIPYCWNDNRYLVYRNRLFNGMGDMVCYVYSLYFLLMDRHKRKVNYIEE